MIISITNTKGGVGKTTTAVNLAAAFADGGRRTLLIDLDPQAHSTRYFVEEEPEKDVGDLIMDRPSQAARAVLQTEFENLDIVPATSSLTETAELLSTRIRREERLAKALDHLVDSYQEILLDCPPTLGILAYNAIIAADLLLVPVQTGVGAVSGLQTLLETAEELRGEESVPYRILITMFDQRTTRTNALFDDLIAGQRRRLLKTIIYKSESLNQANLAGMTAKNFSPSSRGAQDYDDLCTEILRLRIRT